MMNKPIAFKMIFGQSDAYQLILQLPHTETAESTADSIRLEIIAHAGNFYGSCLTTFTVSILQELLRALTRFTTQAYGEFTLYSEGREFWASLTGNGSGKFSAHCTLNDCDHKYTRLRFQVNFDSSELPAIIAALQQILNVLES